MCHDLNDLYGQYAELKARYDEIMVYWKQQRKRGYITPEEYRKLAETFEGARSDEKKEEYTNGENP